MPILAPALLTMAAAQLLDLATFMTMIGRVGIGSEANPIVVGVFEDGGVPAVVLTKVALVVLVGAVTVALLAARGHIERRVGWAVLASAIAAGILGGWTNAATLGVL